MKPGIKRLLLAALFLASSLAAAPPFAASDLFPGAAAPLDSAEPIEATLVADTASIAAGKEFPAGLWVHLQPGWHVFWQFPGGPGTPVSVTWELPAGFQAGPIEWPLPERSVDAHSEVSYVYEHEVLLPVRITAPAHLPTGGVTLKAQIGWQICSLPAGAVPGECRQGKSAVEAALRTDGKPASANAESFAKWQARLPKSTGPFKTTWDFSHAEQIVLRVTGVPSAAALEFYPLPPAGVQPGTPVIAAPATDGPRTITIPIDKAGAPGVPWRGLLVTGKAEAREGWLVASAPVQPWTFAPPADEAAPGHGFQLMLVSAFIGGLLLNVMPCVLPVIALKIFGFVKQAGEAPERVFRLGLAFVAGVFVFFLGIAGAVVALRAAGHGFNWGLQFQNPYLFAGLISAVFVFGLSLLGIFEFTLSSGATTKLSLLSSREGYAGAFLHGLFTTFLGASCTAPFLGPSLFYATTQAPLIVFAIFLAVAAGMSLPYLLLTAHPAWMRFLPKPGPWMERTKQLAGFVMLGVTAWLLGIFAVTRPEGAAGLIHYLCLLGLACWLLGSLRQRFVALAGAAALAAAGYFLLLQSPLAIPPGRRPASHQSGGIDWQPFSAEELSQGVKSGRPVFIDFTADWCANCQTYEKFVLETPAIRAGFRDRQVLPLQADLTVEDPVLSEWLHRFGGAGLPLYVLFLPGEKQPIVLHGLTPGILLGHLNPSKS